MTKNKLNATLFHQSVHLREQELLPPSVTCPLCTSTERAHSAFLQKGPDVVLLYCRNCHAASASRMPKPETLEKYYSRYYDDKEVKITLDDPNRMAFHIVQYALPSLGDLAGRDIYILDYGGGDGSISSKVAQLLLGHGAAKINIALVDYDQSTLSKLSECIEISRPDNLTQIDDRTMDLVIASAVVEHIPEPREILVRLLTSLKNNGVFYARTPYVTPLSKIAKAFNVNFDFTFPAHVHDLGAKFWNNVIYVLPLEGEFNLLRSTPSIVETSFKQHFWRSLAAHVLKVPGYAFKETYGLVGGWEVFLRRRS